MEVVVREPDVLLLSAAAEAESHSVSLSRAREMALLRCLRAREAARAGDGEKGKGEEIEDIMMVGVGFIQAGMRLEVREGGGRVGLRGSLGGSIDSVNKCLSWAHRCP